MKNPLSSASQVRVGVRIRPLTRQEVDQGGKMVLAAQAPEVRLGERRFTYDAVFDASVTQADLYCQVSGPLQSSFLDGYNATIMAYGQTGSGKTFTMGSEAHTELEVSQNTGLIPRFMSDLFEQLRNKIEKKGLSEYKLRASFLEVYGEDVHDLLDPSRKSLPLREDANGGVVCSGLTDRQVSTAAEALQILHEGTMNRTTAATLMNLTSSRSHAVFTVTLTQVCNTDGVDVTTTSRFTFVDLAGSERMKKTGAEGERAREGIKINEGLLALGNVINALADEDRLAEGKKIHVPYRQSKLTRLLQDALGGNSQTLFLACVSPSDTNASETLSTLHYANRARNIKNAPTKNVDASLLELQRLQAYNRVLQAELVRHKFGEASSSGEEEFEQPSDQLMMRREVNDYLCRLHSFAQESIDLVAQPLTFSHGASNLVSSSLSSGAMQLVSPRRAVCSNGASVEGTPNRTIMEQCDNNLLMEVNPDEEMAILNQLLELQQKDQDFDNEQKKDVAELKQMDGELAEQEAMLLQLRDSLRVYHDMKTKYEKLMAEVQQLEAEKAELAEQLEKATADPTQGCSTAIKKELEKVERSLSRARNETRRHRQMYRKAEQEAQKCRTLERKLTELKTARANLIKRQKEAATRHREYTESKTREILQLKKKERVAKQKMSKLENEIQIHKKNLDKRQVYNKKLAEKLKQTETHLMKLLSMRRREFRDRTSTIGSYRRSSTVLPPNPNRANSFAPEESEELKSLQFLLEKGIADHIHHEEVKSEYEDRVNEYTETMRSIVDAVGKLGGDPMSGDLEDEIEEKELKVELLASEMERLRDKLGISERLVRGEPLESVRNLIGDKDAPVMRTLLLNFIKRIAEIKLAFRKSTLAIERKESVINSFESEVETLNARIAALMHQIAHHHSLNESGEDPVEMVASLEEEKAKLLEHSKNLEKEIQSLKETETVVTKEKSQLESQLATALEKASIIEIALQQSGGVEPPAGVLAELQSNWEKLGTSFGERQNVRIQIENCLEDTCRVKLEETKGQIAQTQQEISELERSLKVMYQSLGEDPPFSEPEVSSTLLVQLEVLRLEKKKIEPRFPSAIERRNILANHVRSLVKAMGMNGLSTLDQDLQLLVKDAETQDKHLQDPCNLGDDFLARCEKHVSALRLEKSKVLANNSTLQRKALGLVSEMNLAEEDILPIVAHSIRKRCSDLPEWWKDEIANAVVRAVAVEGGVVRSTMVFAQHLNVFVESLESVSEGRRILSTKLRDLVKRAQKTLLETVDGEGDAAEAYSSFHDALFRLPLLSKEHVYACISEMKALILGVEAMTQSEIEALTVVWEALNISTSARGEFWGKIEESLLSKDSNPEGPFHEVVQSSSFDSEEWVLVAVKEATQSFVQLESRLFKLEKIHEEVEMMSARQDAKSKIISLDSEIRLLNAKLSEFEDEKCGKERLVTKKNTSSNLLKEERFRKQMQTKFSSKLEQLAKLLKSWHNEQNYTFDPNLLSDEVRVLLANFDDIDTLVEKRTEFMHLRTTRAKTSSKRAPLSRAFDDQKPPPAKRQVVASASSGDKTASRTIKNTRTTLKVKKDKPSASPTSDQTSRETNKRKAEQNSKSPFRLPKVPRLSRQSPGQHVKQAPVPAAGSNTGRMPLSPVRKMKKKEASSTSEQSPGKKLTLLPFGRVLEQARTPRKNKENEDLM